MPFGTPIGLGGANFNTLPEAREHPALSRIALGVYAAETASQGSYECKRARRKERTGMILSYDQTDAASLVIPRGVAEMFGYRLAESAGVRVPRVTLTPDEPTAEDFKTRLHRATEWAQSAPEAAWLSRDDDDDD